MSTDKNQTIVARSMHMHACQKIYSSIIFKFKYNSKLSSMVAKKYAAKKKLKILLFIIDHSGRKYSTMIFITTHLIMHSVSKLTGN